MKYWQTCSYCENPMLTGQKPPCFMCREAVVIVRPEGHDPVAMSLMDSFQQVNYETIPLHIAEAVLKGNIQFYFQGQLLELPKEKTDQILSDSPGWGPKFIHAKYAVLNGNVIHLDEPPIP